MPMTEILRFSDCKIELIKHTENRCCKFSSSDTHNVEYRNFYRKRVILVIMQFYIKQILSNAIIYCAVA